MSCGGSQRQGRFKAVINVKRCFSRYTQRLKTVFLAHARAEHDLAREMAEFLGFGCNLTCYVEDNHTIPLTRVGKPLRALACVWL